MQSLPIRGARRALLPSMAVAVLCLATGGAYAGLAGAPWPKFRGDATNTGRGAGSGATGVTRWTGGEAPFEGYVASPVIGPDGTVYIANSRLRAYDGVTGSLKWVSDFPASADFIKATAAVGADGYLYLLGQEGSVYKCDTQTGVVVRVNALSTDFHSSAALAPDGTIYAGGSDGLYALDGVTGTPKWSYSTTGGVQNCPAVGADGTIYFGDDGGTVYAVNANTRHEKWASTGTGTDPILSSPAVGDDGTVYVGSDNGHVYALGASDGEVIWDFTTGGSVESSPALGENGMVYVGSFDGNVYAINAATGAAAWAAPHATGDLVKSSPAVAADGTVYVASQDGKLYALDGATGHEDWSYPLLPNGGMTNSPAIAADGTVYAAAASGPLIAIRAAVPLASDAAGALKIAGGLLTAPGGFSRADPERTGASGGHVDILDAVRLARQASHLDAVL